jgi:polyhydroxyalkanoate synthesis repressor PhaR
MIEIKKYSNRRLYNTDTSSYITQEDIVELIKKGMKFKIYDADTKKDITSNILTQIVLDRENSGTNMIPEEFLKQIILFSERQQAADMFGFLNNVHNFAQSNNLFTQGFQNMLKLNPFDLQSYFNMNGVNNKTKEPAPKDKQNNVEELLSQVEKLKTEIDQIKKKEKAS